MSQSAKPKRRAAKNKAAKLKLLLHNDLILRKRIHALRVDIIDKKPASVRWFYVAKYWLSLKSRAWWEEFKRVRYW